MLRQYITRCNSNSICCTNNIASYRNNKNKNNEYFETKKDNTCTFNKLTLNKVIKNISLLLNCILTLPALALLVLAFYLWLLLFLLS